MTLREAQRVVRRPDAYSAYDVRVAADVIDREPIERLDDILLATAALLLTSSPLGVE